MIVKAKKATITNPATVHHVLSKILAAENEG